MLHSDVHKARANYTTRNGVGALVVSFQLYAVLVMWRNITRGLGVTYSMQQE